jgi:hypothetical protein
MSAPTPHESVRLPVEITSIESDGRIVVARWGPLPEDARRALARQAELHAPTKLVLSGRGHLELRAEVRRTRGADAAGLAHGALDLGRAWLAGEPLPGGPEPDPEDLSSALAELPPVFAWSRGEDGFRIHATAFGESLRLRVLPVPGGVQVIARSALSTPEPCARDALEHFALETNRRLRLARIGVDAAGDTTAVSWDRVTPFGVDLAVVLPAAVEAVVRAHAPTRRSLRALCHAEVARTYLAARHLAARGPEPQGRRSPRA